MYCTVLYTVQYHTTSTSSKYYLASIIASTVVQRYRFCQIVHTYLSYLPIILDKSLDLCMIYTPWHFFTPTPWHSFQPIQTLSIMIPLSESQRSSEKLSCIILWYDKWFWAFTIRNTIEGFGLSYVWGPHSPKPSIVTLYHTSLSYIPSHTPRSLSDHS